ncbi:MAG: toprim domain-containing protein [Sarcina ventriculi]|nr:toprim domain-containing protein [Sarcina ventriculi]
MDIEQAKLIPIQEILYKYGDICPKCGHKLDIGNTNRCRCHKCNTIYSTVDLIQALYGINIPEAIKILIGEDIKPVEKKQLEKIRIELKEKQLEKEKHNKQVNNMIFKNSIEPTQACLEYLDSRCIKDSLKGLDKAYIEIKSNIYNGNETIIYRFKKQGTGIQKALSKNKDGKRFVRNIGTVKPVFHKAYDSNKYIIVEGIEDALTCHVLGYNFICLNSISNTGRLIDIIKNNIEKFRDKELLICTDYDRGGMECFEELEKFFSLADLMYGVAPFYIDMLENKCKDINEYFVKIRQQGGNKILNDKN